MIIEIILACTLSACGTELPDSVLNEVSTYYEKHDVDIDFIRHTDNHLLINSQSYSPEQHVKLTELIRSSGVIYEHHAILIVAPDFSDLAYEGWASVLQQSLYIAPQFLDKKANLIAHEIGHLRGHPHFCDGLSHPVTQDVLAAKSECEGAENNLMHEKACFDKKLSECEFDKTTRFSHRMWAIITRLHNKFLGN